MRYIRLVAVTEFCALVLVGVSCQPQVTQPRQTWAPKAQEPLTQAPEPVKPVAAPEAVLLEPKPVPVQHAIKVLPVPFFPQAPYANWDATHEEACEEAAMLMVVEYFSGNRAEKLEPAYAEQKILELIEWETEQGYQVDVTAAEVARILSDRFGLTANIESYSALAVRAAIDGGKLVIIPAAGRLLGNPFFKQPGPLYHMLVVKGYDGGEFITNDPGTKRGESYRYTESDFVRAVHDWNGGSVTQGEQVMVVVEK